MKRKKPSTPQQLYQAERDRVGSRREAALAQVMEEARRQFEEELEANRAKGRGGRPRKTTKDKSGA